MPSRTKGAHHRGTYDVESRRVVAAAKANPWTRCARCGRTLAQHPPTRTGNPPRWSAGHARDGEVGGTLRPEVLSCNARAGQRLSTQRGRRRQPRIIRTDLTW